MNKLIKSLIYGGDISLSVLDCTRLVQKAVNIHGLADAPARTLGGLLTVCAYFSGCLKSPRGAVSITVKSPSGDGTVSVSGDKNLHIRGYIDCAGGGKLRGGNLTVIRDDGFYRPFVGSCELVSDDVAENTAHYFAVSEQIPTLLSVGVDVRDGKCLSAGAVVMQSMPGCSDESAAAAIEKMRSLKDIGGLIKNYGADGVAEKFFGEETEKTAVYTLFPEYKCNCSRKKIEGVILPLGKSELESIIAERGEVCVHCHYCNTDYRFTAEDIEKLFA